MKPIFILVCTIHIVVWMIVLVSFLNETLAYYNLYYFIPFIYLIHMLPFHILTTMEKKIYPNSYKEKFDKIKKYSIVGELYEKLNKKLNFCFFNPLSPQGMLIFGAISSAYKLKIYK